MAFEPVHLLVTVQVQRQDAGGELPRERVVSSVMEAVREALEHGENRGFNHPLEDELSLTLQQINLCLYGFASVSGPESVNRLEGRDHE